MGNAIKIDGLPAHVRVVADEGVWLESEAVRQLARVACDPDCVRAVGMPDLHPGPGQPIGAAFAFERTVRPAMLGGDIGCGALVVALSRVKLSSTLDRRVEAEFERAAEAPELDIDEVERALAALAPELEPPGAWLDADSAVALGSIGGGNHFAEIGRVVSVVDRDGAEEAGLRKGELALLCHSGSRGLGKVIADRWANAVLDARDATQYLSELAGAIRFARANRAVLAWRLLKALGAARDAKIAGRVDVVHNTVALERTGDRDLWVHRKGCAPAHRGQLTVVLGSRGAPSWIMRGSGNPEGLSSVAHGAGRKMQRAEAREKLREKYLRKQLSRSAIGSRVLCDDPKLLYEEHPDAYKPIEPVIASLESAGLAERVAAIEPILTVKK